MNHSDARPVFVSVRHATGMPAFVPFTPLPDGFDGEVAIVPAAAFRALLAVTTDETQSSRPEAGGSGNLDFDSVSERPPWA